MTIEDLGGWSGVLARLDRGESLSSDDAAAVLGDVLEGNATSAQIAGFALGLRNKGETMEEMSGLVRAMLDHAEPVHAGENLVDTCGTGGDGSHTINVSTIAALVVAGAGAKVCKHGNRGASGSGGSADVLEALGVVVDLGPDGVARCVAEAGMGFCLAPRFHSAFRQAVPTRRELGMPTVFNFLLPLTNPARPTRQVVGVSDPAMAEKMLSVMAANGVMRAMVVHGHDGMDELTTTTTSTVTEWQGGAFSHTRTYVVDPAELGLASAGLEQLRGADAQGNADMARRVLEGERGPHRDLVLLNAAAGLVVAGYTRDLKEGLARAADAIDSGSARRLLRKLVSVSQAAAEAGG